VRARAGGQGQFSTPPSSAPGHTLCVVGANAFSGSAQKCRGGLRPRPGGGHHLSYDLQLSLGPSFHRQGPGLARSAGRQLQAISVLRLAPDQPAASPAWKWPSREGLRPQFRGHRQALLPGHHSAPASPPRWRPRWPGRHCSPFGPASIQLHRLERAHLNGAPVPTTKTSVPVPGLLWQSNGLQCQPQLTGRATATSAIPVRCHRHQNASAGTGHRSDRLLAPSSGGLRRDLFLPTGRSRLCLAPRFTQQPWWQKPASRTNAVGLQLVRATANSGDSPRISAGWGSKHHLLRQHHE